MARSDEECQAEMNANARQHIKKEWRGRKQDGPVRSYLATLRGVFTKSDSISDKLGEIFHFARNRREEAEKIAWLNGLPPRVMEALLPYELLMAYSSRDYKPLGRQTRPHRVAVVMVRRGSRAEIQRKWDARKVSNNLKANTAAATATPAKVARF